ncbi:MAG TPA: hypothetical protein ENI63_00770 [Candidatus Kaiserbacteria bacterium]|nr:hypothetical protein [Candidatus Kaiserbacteria bacterium]
MNKIEEKLDRINNIVEMTSPARADVRFILIELLKDYRQELIDIGAGLKFPSKDGGTKEMPNTEYLPAKPAHESNEIFMQYAHNEAITNYQNKISNHE